MNYPSALPFAILCLVFVAPLLAGCPPADDPAKDDSSKPADGDSGGHECAAEDQRIAELEAANEKLEAELAACANPAPK